MTSLSNFQDMFEFYLDWLYLEHKGYYKNPRRSIVCVCIPTDFLEFEIENLFNNKLLYLIVKIEINSRS